MILLSSSKSSIKGTLKIFGFISYIFLLRQAIFCMCVIWKKNLLFSTLILGSVFSDYVVFYGDSFLLTYDSGAAW